MNYEEKKQAKIEYAKNKSSQLRASSDEFFSKGFCERTGIPLGQPILIGHHSERRHRNAIKRYDNQVRKNIENAEKAEYYQKRAERLENDTTISSDDPEAINKLNKEIKRLENQKEIIKLINKHYKKNKSFDGLDVPQGYIEKALQNMKVWNDDIPFPSYELRNIGGRIKQKKQRIEHLKRISKIEDIEIKIGDIEIKIDKEDNRIKVFFPSIPSQEVRTRLKSNGFRWSPYNKCWQSYINDWNLQNAKQIAGEC